MSRATQLAEWLARERPEFIDDAVAMRIRQDLAPISATYLRRLLLKTGVPLDPLIEGVNIHTPEDAERTLTALADLYEAGETKRTRALAIEAKQRLRWTLAKHPEREETLLWVMTWLENPGAFRSWIQLRRNAVHALGCGRASS